MRRIPTNSFYSSVRAILSSALRSDGKDDVSAFESAFADYVGAKRAFLVGSGTSALYIILKALSRFSEKTEVILPAYTVPTLTLAIRRAGLTTRLTDINIDTFNMDTERLSDSISKNTLAVVPVHMFGFPMDLDKIKELSRSQDFFVVEDAAQAPGAELFGERVGGLSEVGIFSMCKGKILSTFRGGVITSNDPEISKAITEEIKLLRNPGRLFDLRLFFTLLLMSGAIKPGVYGALYPMIALFKSTKVHTHFEPGLATPFAARLGLVQLDALGGEVKKRVKNGTALYEGLSGIDGIRLPKIIEGGAPSFNHLPIMIEREGKIDEIISKLFGRGIDTARMYLKPIHSVYDLDYVKSPDPFPNATRLSEELLVLPAHPGVTERDVAVIIETIIEIMG
jgi:perosamine synthetase